MTQPPFRPRLPPVPPAGALASADPTPQAVRAARLALGATPLGQGRRAPDPALDSMHLPALPEVHPQQPARDGGRAWLVLNAASGWRREAALRLLDPPVSACELAALLDRLNDWVPEVRRAAEQRLTALTPVIAPDLVAEVALALVLRIERGGRLSPIGRAAWQALLSRPASLAALAAALRHAQGAGVQRAALRLLRDPALDAALPDLAQHAAHPGLRALALAACLNGAVVWHAGWRIDKATQAALPDWRRRPLSVPADPGALAQAAVGDRAAQVRKALAEGLPRLDPALALPLAHRLAVDRNAAVRLRAGFFLDTRAG